jgi:hypothetical protein
MQWSTEKEKRQTIVVNIRHRKLHIKQDEHTKKRSQFGE